MSLAITTAGTPTDFSNLTGQLTSLAFPAAADQIRSYHPWGYLNDESSFQPDAGECYNEAIAAVKGRIIFKSSIGPGWFADARKDIIRNEED